MKKTCAPIQCNASVLLGTHKMGATRLLLPDDLGKGAKIELGHTAKGKALKFRFGEQKFTGQTANRGVYQTKKENNKKNCKNGLFVVM